MVKELCAVKELGFLDTSGFLEGPWLLGGSSVQFSPGWVCKFCPSMACFYLSTGFKPLDQQQDGDTLYEQSAADRVVPAMWESSQAESAVCLMSRPTFQWGGIGLILLEDV